MKLLTSTILVCIGVAIGAGIAHAYPKNKQRIIQVIKARFGPHWPTAVRVAECESHLNPNAVSSSGDHGLFQINYQAHKNWVNWRKVYQPTYNAYVAWILSRHGEDWGAWGNSRGCWG